MTDIEFLDSLEFRVRLRRGDDCRLIELPKDDSDRLDSLQGFGHCYYVHSFSKGSLLQAIEAARSHIADQVADKLTNTLR